MLSLTICSSLNQINNALNLQVHRSSTNVIFSFSKTSAKDLEKPLKASSTKKGGEIYVFKPSSIGLGWKGESGDLIRQVLSTAQLGRFPKSCMELEVWNSSLLAFCEPIWLEKNNQVLQVQQKNNKAVSSIGVAVNA